MRSTLLGLTLAAACVGAALAAPAPGYETAQLVSLREPGAVRSCLASVLSSRARPIETPNVEGREATAWDIAFLHQRDTKVVRVERFGVGQTRVLYPRRLGVESAPVHDLVRACT